MKYLLRYDTEKICMNNFMITTKCRINFAKVELLNDQIFVFELKQLARKTLS